MRKICLRATPSLSMLQTIHATPSLFSLYIFIPPGKSSVFSSPFSFSSLSFAHAFGLIFCKFSGFSFFLLIFTCVVWFFFRVSILFRCVPCQLEFRLANIWLWFSRLLRFPPKSSQSLGYPLTLVITCSLLLIAMFFMFHWNRQELKFGLGRSKWGLIYHIPGVRACDVYISHS